jgi:hypothetical protein
LTRREELQGQLENAEEPPPLLHPEMAGLYRENGDHAGSGLEHPDTPWNPRRRSAGSSTAFVTTPVEEAPPSLAGEESRFGEPRLRIELKGNRAAMLGATAQSKRAPETEALSLQGSMVPGACNEVNLEFSWTAA